MQENKRMEEELDEFRAQEQIANAQGSTQTLEREKVLEAVNTASRTFSLSKV